jgi:dTDP-4-amino-4,6-dideoxygalactose transaminase
VLVPDMPTADDLLPWLRRIDETRHYVKNGPLVRQFEGELETLVGSPCRVVANGTVSLELALRALDLTRGAGVLVPAVTFVASGQAIVNAGLVPVICDVHPHTWQLDAEHAEDLYRLDGSIIAAMPVAAFGRPVPVEPWERFANQTGCHVLIDAAGAIYGQQASRSPAVVISYSVNATKALGAGEGGVVASDYPALLERVESIANFGPGGTNARMSEYHAAVALASLRTPADPIDWRHEVRRRYIKLLAESAVMVTSAQVGSRDTMCQVLLLSESACAEEVVRHMAERGIETKQWYRPFLDELPQFAACQKWGPMPVTNMLRQRLLGLPFHRFLTADDVRTVCAELAQAINH